MQSTNIILLLLIYIVSLTYAQDDRASFDDPNRREVPLHQRRSTNGHQRSTPPPRLVCMFTNAIIISKYNLQSVPSSSYVDSSGYCNSCTTYCPSLCSGSNTTPPSVATPAPWWATTARSRTSSTVRFCFENLICYKNKTYFAAVYNISTCTITQRHVRYITRGNVVRGGTKQLPPICQNQQQNNEHFCQMVQVTMLYLVQCWQHSPVLKPVLTSALGKWFVLRFILHISISCSHRAHLDNAGHVRQMCYKTYKLQLPRTPMIRQQQHSYSRI